MVKVEVIIREEVMDKQSVVTCYIQECQKATTKEYLIARSIASHTYDFVKDKDVDDLVKISKAAEIE